MRGLPAALKKSKEGVGLQTVLKNAPCSFEYAESTSPGVHTPGEYRMLLIGCFGPFFGSSETMAPPGNRGRCIYVQLRFPMVMSPEEVSTDSLEVPAPLT